MLPGRTSASLPSLRVGVTTATVGIAASAAAWRCSLNALNRDTPPMIRISSAIAAAPIPIRFSRALLGPSSRASSEEGNLCMARLQFHGDLDGFVVPVGEGEDGGHEE